MYHTALTGMPTTDNHVQAWPAICESIKRMAQLACPEVVDVHAIGPYYIAVVAIKKRLAYEARNVILSVLVRRPALPRPSIASWSIPRERAGPQPGVVGALHAVPAE